MSRFGCVVSVLAGSVVLLAGGCGDIHQSGLVGLEDCINGVDDNGDGDVDCADVQCTGHAACLEFQEYACDNGVDDDGDGQQDCDDPDCQVSQACNPDQELACHDGVDNDGDGKTDCRDPDCQGSDACWESCDDGEDNDQDGLVDCADPDCEADALCGGGEICNNGYDDDGDGAVDCDDDDCIEVPACDFAERCDNGYDDDGDGAIDCDDGDCAGNPYCMELFCADSIDNDGNGLIDCDDAACAGMPGCIASTNCVPSLLLFCNDSISSSTAGRLSNFDTYGCNQGSYPGGEMYYNLLAYYGWEVTVFLADNSTNQDLQLVVSHTTDAVGGCDANDPCDSADVSTVNDQQVTVASNTVTNLWIIVDSSTAAGGDFDLTVTCLLPNEIHCADGINDDGDGLIDCWDSDCDTDPLCNYWVDAGVHCAQWVDECRAHQHHFCWTVPNTNTGFCSRSCNTPGQPGGECDTHDPGLQGYCLYESGGSSGNCVFRCGSLHPGTSCPVGWTCVNADSGSALNPESGVCVPS